MAALAANKQGKFWEFHRKLFENHKSLNNVKMQEIARKVDMDLDRFNRDMADPGYRNSLPEIRD